MECISKKERTVHPSGRDLLSDLPLCIIHIILALVPIRDAIRTSLLSRQWRYTWATFPCLAFDHTCASYSEDDHTRLNNFITGALSHHKGPIEKLILYDFYKFNFPDIDECIHLLSRKGIKEFTIGPNECDVKMELSPSIYSCEKLTKLELWNCELDLPPSTFKGFLFLRCLVLRWVSLSDEAIESLVANSPLLETFELDGFGNDELRISAPNLKYLHLDGANFIELCVYAPLLADMSITLYTDSFTTYHANFMGGFSNLEKLSGCGHFTKYLSMGFESCHHTLVFHHLKDIELGVDFEDMKSVSVVVHLIVGAPNLQKLKIINYTSRDDESEARHLSFRDFGCGPNFTFEKLKVVEIYRVRGLPLEMEFINFLLGSSPVLETMGLIYLRAKDKLKLAVELLGFCRASSKAKITFRDF